MFKFVQTGLLADAEIFEYVSQDFIVGNDTQNLTQMGEAEAEVLADEVAREALVHGLTGALYVFNGHVEGLLVTEVGDEDIVLLDRGYGSQELLLKLRDAYAIEGLELGGFVGDADEGLVRTGVEGREGNTRFVHEDDDMGTLGSRTRTLYAKLLDAVVGGTDSSGINKAELCST